MSPKPTTDEAKVLTNITDAPSEIKPIQHHHIESSQKSRIGETVLVKGNVAATGDMLIDGRVEGAVAVKNGVLEIGLTAHIEATVFAKVVAIHGEIKGDVYASDQVLVTQSGKVYGNISAPNVCMEDGALLKGSINMEKQEISWEDSIPEIHEEGHEKHSSFGFLFRRTRNHTELSGGEVPANKPDESCPIPLDIKTNHECNAFGKSLIGRTVLVKGIIESGENMIIDGEFNGTIYFKEHGLEVGSQAHINGSVFVKFLVVYGEIKGDINASDHIAVKKPGNVIANVVRSPRVSIESGAILKGKVEMETQNIEEAYSQSVASSATREKANFLNKHSLDTNHAAFEDNKLGLQSSVTGSKTKRAPWPE